MEYANLLKSKIPSWGNLLLIMRAYLYVHLVLIALRVDNFTAAKYLHFANLTSHF